jgi:hypothetical protein
VVGSSRRDGLGYTYWNIANRKEKRMEKIAVAAKSIQDTLAHWGEKDEDEE